MARGVDSNFLGASFASFPHIGSCVFRHPALYYETDGLNIDYKDGTDAILLKALHSRINLSAFDTDIAMEYYPLVSDLLFSEPVLRLADWEQHKCGTRLQHSINVSYYAFLLSRKLGLDSRAVARGGLLHDLYFFDTNDEDVAGRHMRLHPQVALQNAEALTELSDMERDIIATHMWPVGERPKYKESFLVGFVDKYCASAEYVDFLRLRLRILGLATLRSPV